MFLAVLARGHVPSTEYRLNLEEPVRFVPFSLGPNGEEEGTRDLLAVNSRNRHLRLVDGSYQVETVLHLGVAVAELCDINNVLYTQSDQSSRTSLMHKHQVGSTTRLTLPCRSRSWLLTTRAEKGSSSVVRL